MIVISGKFYSKYGLSESVLYVIIRIYRRRSAASCCSTMCCLFGLIAAIIIAAAIAIGIYFIIKSSKDGDSTNNSKFQINT